MTTSTQREIKNYRGLLQAKEIPFEEAIAPPVYARGKIRERLLAATGHAPEALIDWFAWHNGVKDVGRVRSGFFHDYDPISLDEAIDFFTYSRWLGLMGSPSEFNPHLPFLSRSTPGNMMLLDLKEGAVVLSYGWGVKRLAIADTLARLLELWGEFTDEHCTWNAETQFIDTIPAWGDLDPEFRARMGLN